MQRAMSDLWHHGLEVASRGDIPPLRVLCMDVALATHDATPRTPTDKDPVVAIACTITTLRLAEQGGAEDIRMDGSDADEVDVAAPVHGNAAAEVGVCCFVCCMVLHHNTARETAHTTQQRAVFVLGPDSHPPSIAPDLHLVRTEAELLTAWMDWLQRQDPDCLLVYQVEHSLGALVNRVKALGLRGGGLRLGRLLASTPLALKRITMYSAAWVKSQVIGAC